MADTTIRDFFRRHAAVPATDAGACWGKASEEALLGWFNRLVAVVRCGYNRELGRDATPAEREASRPAYEAVAAEVRARATRPGASDAVQAAAIRASFPASWVR